MDSRAKGDPRGEFPRNLSSAEDNANEIPLAGAEIKRDAGLLIHAIYNFLSRTIGSATATRSNYSTKFINGRGNSCSRVPERAISTRFVFQQFANRILTSSSIPWRLPRTYRDRSSFATRGIESDLQGLRYTPAVLTAAISGSNGSSGLGLFTFS